MTLLYWFRKNTRSLDRPGTIYCRITVDGVEYNFATVVRLFKDEWNATSQEMRGRSDAARVANQQLQQLADGLRESFNILERAKVYITPERVVERYRKPQARQLTVREVSVRYLSALDQQQRHGHISPATREAYGIRLARLDEWLLDTHQCEMRPAELTVRRAKVFFDYLLAKPRSRNYSIKVLDAVQGMLRWAVRTELLDQNPMEGFSERQEETKMPVFLSPAELVKLWYFDFASQSLRRIADLFLFQCFTGLAYQDMANFRASQHLLPQPNGAVLLRLERQKSGTPALIPFLRPAVELLARYGGERLPVLSLPMLNRALKQIGYLLGFKQHLTTHVGRKTAGMLLLQDGVSLTVVSHILGHKSVRITERYYARVLPDTVVNELAKTYGPQVVGIQQARKPFLAEFTERLLQAA